MGPDHNTMTFVKGKISSGFGGYNNRFDANAKPEFEMKTNYMNKRNTRNSYSLSQSIYIDGIKSPANQTLDSNS